jgi:hypothetical protein
MKIIFDTALQSDNVTNISASTTYSGYPVSNLQDDYLSSLWRAGVSATATLTVTISKGSSLALYNTNATSIGVTVSSGGGYTTKSNLNGVNGWFWLDYTYSGTSHTVTLDLTCDASQYACGGVLRAGSVITFNDPAPGITESSYDYSVEVPLSNGTNYFRKRPVVRNFTNLSIIETKTNAFIFKYDIFDMIGPKPLAIRLVQNAGVSDAELVIYAKRLSSPNLVFIKSALIQINFELQEVV